ncbi:MAG: glycosyltransferase [Pseudomonadota bacterium]
METYSERLVAALADHADVSTLVLPGNADGSVPGAGALFGFGFRAAWRLGTGTRADVTHVGDMASWPLALVAALRGRSRPVAISAHGTDVAFARRSGWAPWAYRQYMWLGGRLLRGARVIANSEATAEAARELGFATVSVVPLATDMVRQDPTPGTGPLLFPGRVARGKGLRWFVETVLPALPENLRLQVAGTVWHSDEAEALRHPKVEHLGRLDAADLARAYASALAVIVPKITVPGGEMEGFGLVAVEAAAAGGVVIASDHSGLKDAVLDGETGFKVPPGEPDPWIEKIAEIAAWTPAARAAFVERASGTAARVYNWERVAADTFAAYGWCPR